MKLTVDFDVSCKHAAADALRQTADDIEEGFTSGNTGGIGWWDLDGEDEDPDTEEDTW